METFNVFSQTTMFNVDPKHSGVYNSNFASDLMMSNKWKFKTNGKIFSSGVVLNDIIYFGSDDSCLYALHDDGTLNWKFKSNGKVCSTPAVKDTVVYFNNYGGMFYAVNTKTGKEIWSFKTDGEKQYDEWDFYLSSPVIVDSIVYFGSGKNMYALNITKAELVWKYAATGLIHSSPAVSSEMIYFGCWDGKLYALNTKTGTKVWTYSTGDGIASSPSIVDSIVLIGSRDTKVYAIHAKTGKIIWSQGFSSSWMPSSFAILNNIVYTGSSDVTRLYGLNLTNGKILGSANTKIFTFSTPAIAGSTAFIGAMNGSLFAVDINTFKIKCKFNTDGRIKNPLKAVNPDGSLSDYVRSLSEWLPPLLTAGCILSTPVIDKNNVVYFGSVDSTFYAIYDDGKCRPHYEVSTDTIDLGKPISTIIDTAIFIKNTSDCLDSIKVYNELYFPAPIDIQPSNFILESKDSVKVHFSLNTSKLAAGRKYKIQIAIQSKTNECYLFNTELMFSTSSVTGVSEVNKSKSDVAFPNPFNESVVIKYSIEQNCLVDIRIYNPSGQLQKILTSKYQEIGVHQITWDGSNDNGDKLKSGIYFCSIKKGNSIVNKELFYINK